MEPEVRHKPVRYYEVDLLRFLAALSVVLYHYTYRGYAADNYSPLPFLELGRFTKYGHLGVQLFFIVSGYVVLLSVQGKTLRQFFLSRITRLYPAFWAACTLTFLVKCIWGTTVADVHMSPLLQAGVKQYVFNMTMLHEFFGIAAIDGAYWSLTIEITFYFLIALLLGFKLMQHMNLCLTLWLAYTALPSAMHIGTPFSLLFFPSGAPYFAAGMLFYLIQQPQGRTWQRYALLLASYLLALRSVIGKINAEALWYHEAGSHAVGVGIVTLFFGVFLLIVFRKINLSRFTWLSWLGALTYPLYLVHSDIGFIAFHRLHHLFNKYVLLGGVLLAVFIMAYLIHVLVEKRFSKPLGVQVNKWLVRLDHTQ
jgi:peptidoglycan/LPS O-acetylase OafA/YrhL